MSPSEPTAQLNLEPVPQCPVCASAQSSPLDQASDRLVPEINRYLPADETPLPAITNTRVTCARCKLVYLSPRLDTDGLRELYRLWYGYAYRSIFSDPQHLADRTTEFTRHHLRYLQKHIPTPGTLLDVGSGSGLFLSIARGYGWQGTGVELDRATAEWASSEYGLDIRFGTLESAVQQCETFDAITMFDYLEHTDRPGPDLAAAARHLKPSGLIVIRVPNQAGWQSRFMKQGWLAVISNHLSYFTPQSLSEALDMNGFEPVDISANNYRSERDILRQRWQWLKQRLSKSSPAPSDSENATPTQPTAAGAAPQGSLRQVGRLLHSLLIEQIDHMGGWFGRSNFLMVVARKK